MNKEDKKQIIFSKISTKSLLPSISYLQDKYKIGFSLAYEIYFEHNLNVAKHYFEKGSRYKFVNFLALKSGVSGLEEYIKQLETQLNVKRKRYPDNKYGWIEEYQIEITKFVIKVLKSGIKILKPDLYKSNASSIIIDYKKKTLLMPLTVIGVSEETANIIVKEREKTPFSSFEGLRRRCGATLVGIKYFEKDKVFK